MQEQIHNFEGIYLTYFSRMKSFARAYVLNEEEAENIVQDVFTELWEKRELLTMSLNIPAYLFTSVKNKCLNYLRHETIKTETAGKLKEEQHQTLQISINSLQALNEDIFSTTEVQKIIEKALDSLSDRCRKIFIMSKIEGKKNKKR